MSSRVLLRMSAFRFWRLISRFRIFITLNSRSFTCSISSSAIFSFTGNGMFEHTKFRAITLLEMFLMANVASSGMSSLTLIYWFTMLRRSSMAVLNSRSFFSGSMSSNGVTIPSR